MLDQDCLAASARADHNGCFALFDGQRDIIKNNFGTKLLGYILKDNYSIAVTVLCVVFLLAQFHYTPSSIIKPDFLFTRKYCKSI